MPPEFLSLTTSRKLVDTPDLGLWIAPYRLVSFEPGLFAQHQIYLPQGIACAVKKRQGEFLAGRLMAAKALRTMGAVDLHVAIGEQRLPVWPCGFSGSISHSESFVACLLTTKPSHLVGVDIETIVADATIGEIKSLILNSDEEHRLRQSQLTFATAFTLVFSAKETLFKMLYPQVGYFFDFTAAELISLDDSRLTLRLTLDLGPFRSGTDLNINLHCFDDYVVSYGVLEWRPSESSGKLRKSPPHWCR